MTRLTRRAFLQSSAAVSGSALLIGCSSKGEIISGSMPETPSDQQSLWLAISDSNEVSIAIPGAEMGQGISTACAMMLAEELGCDWESVKVTIAPWNKTFNNPQFRMQMTGGSTTIPSFWEPMRKVGASANLMLRQAAANRWQVPLEAVSVKNSQVMHSDGRALSFGELISEASALDIPDDVALKPMEEHELIGKPVHRVDTPAKTNGSAQFGIDVQFDGLKVATIQHATSLNGKPASLNRDAAMAVKGVEDIVLLENAVAVVADTYWHAKKGLAALNATFEGGETNLSTEGMRQSMRAQLDGEPLPEAKDSAQSFDFEYEVPFLAHATMEPMNCTVQLTEERCDIWVPSQTHTITGNAAKEITGLKPENIHIHLTYLGGGFGRRLEADFVVEALQIAQATNKPIKLIWSREEDTGTDFFRPAALTRYRIGVDENGDLAEWHNNLASPSIFKRAIKSFLPGALNWIPVTRLIDDPVAVEGLKETPYVEKPDFEYHQSNDIPVPVGFWRSVGNSYSGYFTESAIDEVAHAVGKDPYEFRLSQMHDERSKAVLKRVAEAANWGRTDVHQGIAFHKSFGSYVAEVVDLTIDDNKEITLHKITIVADTGIVVNPDTVKAQMEGGMIYGLVAAAEGEINFDQGGTVEKNFDTYPILRMYQTPEIEVILAPSGDAPGGVGEPGTPPIAPALTNAIFAATGDRVRRLPIKHSGYKIGMRA